MNFTEGDRNERPRIFLFHYWVRNDRGSGRHGIWSNLRGMDCDMKTPTEKAEALYPPYETQEGDTNESYRKVYVTGHAEGRREALEMAQGLVDRLCAIIELGKRDMSNPKYDSCFDGAREDLAKFEAWRGGK